MKGYRTGDLNPNNRWRWQWHAHPRVNIWASDAGMVNGLPTSSNSTIITFHGASKPLSTRDVELFLKSTATAYHQKLALF